MNNNEQKAQSILKKHDWDIPLDSSIIKAMIEYSADELQDIEPRITELEMENLRLRGALEYVKLYISTKAPEGYEAYKIAEQALKPKRP
jgi:hypothetical protein